MTKRRGWQRGVLYLTYVSNSCDLDYLPTSVDFDTTMMSIRRLSEVYMQARANDDGLLVSVYAGECGELGADRRAAATYLGELLLDIWYATDVAASCRPDGFPDDLVVFHAALARDDRTVLLFDDGSVKFASELPDGLREYAVGLLESHAGRRRRAATGPKPAMD
nr:hypothetical protein [uncultured Pseudoxanthomonas sp.]